MRLRAKLRIAAPAERVCDALVVDGEGKPFEVTGKYVTVDRPRVLETTWVASWTGNVETIVRWELEPAKQARW